MFEHVFRELITVATVRFHSFTVQYRELASTNLDQSNFLEFVGGHRDSGAAGTQHLRQRFMVEVSRKGAKAQKKTDNESIMAQHRQGLLCAFAGTTPV
jgi:hypothetical protein